MHELLAAEGLADYQYTVSAVSRYADLNEGTEESAMTACREHHAAKQAAEQARQARRERMEQLLQQEGVPSALLTACYPVASYVQHGYGTEEAALDSALKQHQCQQRREAVVAALAAEALPPNYITSCRELAHFISGSEQAPAGGLEGALAAARLQHERDQVQAARRLAVVALLAAEGLPAGLASRVPSIAAHIQDGGGDQATFVPAARAQQELEAARTARSTAMAALLEANGLPYWLRTVVAVRAYIESGEGSEEEALLAARQAYSAQGGMW